MRFKALTMIAPILMTTWVVANGELSFFSLRKHLERDHIKQNLQVTNQIEAAKYEENRKLAKNRSFLYVRSIEAHFLENGMLVNRDLQNDQFIDECDSLLFSSIYMVALSKLGFTETADKAWKNILKSNNGVFWLRHPKCTMSLSRDQLTGLLAALSQFPKGSDRTLSQTLESIRAHEGYFSDGPFYLSFLSPGLGFLLKELAIKHGLQGETLHQTIARSFSSVEVDLVFIQPGYEAHLAALSLWIELELNAPDLTRRTKLSEIGQKLFELDPKNLFFKYLFLRSNGYLTKGTRSLLLNQLLNMPQFPKDRLPTDCDRGADYLWQRASDQWEPDVETCRSIYSGVDFLWIAGLLSDL